MSVQKDILEYLRQTDFGASNTEIAKKLGKSRITVSKNLEILKAKGLIDYKSVGMTKLWHIPSGRANIQSAVAYTDLADEKQAALSLVKDLRAEVADPDFVLVFSSTHIDPGKFFRNLSRGFDPKTKIIGTSTCGEISRFGFTEDSIVALAISSDHISMGVGLAKNLGKDGFKAGKIAAEKALDDIEHDFSKTIAYGTTVKDILKLNFFFSFMFSDFLSEQEENILQGIFSVLGNRCPILGGGSGDNLKYKKTWQYYDKEVYTESVLVALFALDCKTDSETVHGWYPTEKSAQVTRAKGRRVYELNRRRASSVYSEMIGQREEDLIKRGNIAVVENAGAKYVLSITDIHGNSWLKHPNRVYPSGEMSFFANMPENVHVSLNEATPESVIKATDEGLKAALKRINPRVCIIFYAIGRKKFLEGYDAVDEEFKVIQKRLKDVDYIGFFAFGQQGFTSTGVTGHRNQTVNFFFISDELLSRGV